MAPGETRNEGGSPPTLTCLDDIRDLLRRDHVFFLAEGRHLVLPHIVPGQSWALSIGMRAGFLDLIIPMQRLHPMLAHGDIASLMLDVNAQLNLPGFYFDRDRRQVYFRLSMPWGQRGLGPAELRQWVSAARKAVREHGPDFGFIDGRALGEGAGAEASDEAHEAATQSPHEGRLARGDAMRRLAEAALSIRSQRQALKRWLGGPHLGNGAMAQAAADEIPGSASVPSAQPSDHHG